MTQLYACTAGNGHPNLLHAATGFLKELDGMHRSNPDYSPMLGNES
jgi:hypothetical protein